MITVEELMLSRDISGFGLDREVVLQYVIKGTPSESLALTNLLANAPTNWNDGDTKLLLDGLELRPENVDTQMKTCNVWMGTLTYRHPERVEEQEAVDEMRSRTTRKARETQLFSVDSDEFQSVRWGITTEGAIRRFALKRIYTLTGSDEVTGVNVTDNGVDGVEVPVPVLTAEITERLSFAAWSVSMRGYADLVGHVNLDFFPNLGPSLGTGEAMYLGCDADEEIQAVTSEDSIDVQSVFRVTHKFAISPSGQVDVDIQPTLSGEAPSSVEVYKHGWDYMWTLFKDVSTDPEVQDIKMRGLYVDRVFKYSNFAESFPRTTVTSSPPNANATQSGDTAPAVLTASADTQGSGLLYRWQKRIPLTNRWTLAEGEVTRREYLANVGGVYRCLVANRAGTSITQVLSVNNQLGVAE